VPYANLNNPQTLNLYSMVADDPESFADLDGHAGGGSTTSASCGNTGPANAWGCVSESGGELIAGGIHGDREDASLARDALIATAANNAYDQAQNLDSSAEAAKSSAQSTGGVASTKVGGVWVNAYGGTAAQRTDELAAISDDLTHSDRGKEMLKTLEGRKSGLFGLWGSPKPFDIIQMASGGSYSYAGGQAIMLDYHDVGAAYASAHGGGTYSLQRIFAHEMGHAAMGNLDNGPGRMNNVNWNENLVMRQLGDFNDRTAY
jgi:hypothetical protein